MPLLEALPEEVENSLTDLYAASRVSQASELSIPEETPRITFATDINQQGEFGPEWLVLDQDHVYVFAPNGGNRAKVLHAVPLAAIQEVKSEPAVGSGLLQARTDTETIELMRYSQAIVAEANVVARQLTALAKGEPLPLENLEQENKHCPTCKRPLPENSQVCPACMDKRAVMVRLFRFLKPYRSQVIGTLLLLLGATAADLAPPYVAGRIIDLLTPFAQSGSAVHTMTDTSAAVRMLILLVAALAAVRIFSAAIVYGQRRLGPWLGGRITMDIRMALYDKFNQLSLGYYEKRSTGSVMSRVTNDADNLWDFLSDGVPWLISNVLMLIGIGFVLFKMNWQLALLMLTPGPLIYALTSWFMPRARKKWHHVWHRISKMYSTLNSTLTGMRVVKAFAQEGREVNHFRNRNEAVFQASYAANAFWAVYWPVLGLLMSVGSYIIWIFGGYSVLHHAMTLGTLTAFNGYLVLFYQPFQNFSRVVDWSTRSLTAAERVFEVLDTEPDVRESSKPVALPEMQGAVEFDKVSFTYDKAKRVLEDFTLKVEPGEMIGLVGHSGAGKSTIINLLSRFYDVTEGSIKIDGVDIRNVRKEDFRRQFGIVLQEPFLFPGTIRDNIAYAKPDASIEDIMRAAKAGNCHEFILKFPDGYDTQVGERGQRLSGGERQRISIARAILHDPKILILDEATASVDTETEKQIQEAIARLIQNRTTFAIAHRLSTLRNANRLVVMKEGKMVESGTHEELIEKDGVYANLVKIQNEVNKLKAI
jgi:ATP-binding cassette subfamily B protein